MEIKWVNVQGNKRERIGTWRVLGISIGDTLPKIARATNAAEIGCRSIFYVNKRVMVDYLLAFFIFQYALIPNRLENNYVVSDTE